MATSQRTSLGLREKTRQRLETLKPYESISWDEFLNELADTYEEHEN